MTISSSELFKVRELGRATATRPNGQVARQKLKSKLLDNTCVIVDLAEVVLTPSFADEFLGLLLVELGEPQFRKSIRIVNVSESSRPLLKKILSRRASKPNVDVGAHDALHTRDLVAL